MAFGRYGQFYDLYYSAKDYAAEAEFVLALARRLGARNETLLDMGCGTGRHLEEFVRRGLQCDGFDLSPTMLEQARQRLRGLSAGVAQGDLTTFRNGRKYDLVISLFAVMGYLVDNAQLLDGLRTARAHLNDSGLLVFDGWFGPAVLSQRPERRCHEYHDGDRLITRRATPALDPVSQVVTVGYDITVTRGGETLERIEEEHRMRLMFVQEMAMAMASCGLELVHYCPFREPDAKPGLDTWNVCLAARPRAGSRS